MKFSLFHRALFLHILGCIAFRGSSAVFAQQQNASSLANLPATQLINNAVTALGGQAPLANISSVVYRAPKYAPLRNLSSTRLTYIAVSIGAGPPLRITTYTLLTRLLLSTDIRTLPIPFPPMDRFSSV